MPRASDLVAGWFDEVSAVKLIAAGLVNLSEMNAKVAAGGRWYAALSGRWTEQRRALGGPLADPAAN